MNQRCTQRARARVGPEEGGSARRSGRRRPGLAWAGKEPAEGVRISAMAHRPKRTFRQRRADSSDSEDAEEPSAEPGEQAAPGPAAEEGPPPGGGRAEAAERAHRVRVPRGRGRGRGRSLVWASSRRATGAGLRADGGSDVPGDTERRGGRPK